MQLAGKLSALLLGLSFVACGEDIPKQPLGRVQFYLDVPGGQKVDTLQLHLVCAGSGVDITHTLDVKRGEVVAVFGGLQAGSCTVSMNAETQAGVDCIGVQTFTIIPSETVTVRVPLICQGINDGPVGTVKVTTDFSQHDCAADRIKSVYAIPANILVGESSVVQVELYSEAVVGTPKLTWALRNEADDTGQGTLAEAPGECVPGAAACNRFTCTGLGANPSLDPRTQLPIGGVFVTVKYEDDHCFDTEDVWVYCLQGSVCGDGAMGGAEECDDSNTADNDGCSATCRRERCGDGIVQTGEDCDGSGSVMQGQACSAECKLVQAVCGDGVVNQTSEVCDGAVGVVANQQCNPMCQIVPICGNGVVEGTEQCDNISNTMCVDCALTGTGGPTCGDGMVNQASEVCDGTSGLMTGQQCGATCQITPTCGNNIVEGTEQCDSTTDATCVNCARAGQPNACRQCIYAIPEIGPFTQTACEKNPLCAAPLNCLLTSDCWKSGVPVACYCGSGAQALNDCEGPAFVPTGPCAAELKAGAGASATNKDVLDRYFDLAYPSGQATLIVDSAFLECNAQCF